MQLGLVPGDRIVIDGADKLREGAKVIVRAEADPLNPGAVPRAGGGDGGGDKAGGGQRKRRSDGEARQGERKQGEPKQ